MADAVKLTEAEYQQRVIDTAHAHGWLVAHFRPALTRSGRWATPMQGDKGFPDLVLAKGGKVLIAELKADHGRLRPDQRAWLSELGTFGRLWRPQGWEDVLKELKETA